MLTAAVGAAAVGRRVLLLLLLLLLLLMMMMMMCCWRAAKAQRVELRALRLGGGALLQGAYELRRRRCVQRRTVENGSWRACAL